MHLILIVLALFMFPVMSQASPCSDFQWHYPAEIVEPELFKNAREAMESGRLSEARQLFAEFVKEHPEGALAKGGRWALASLPDEKVVDPEKKIVTMIDQLSIQRREHPESPYAPWSLCRAGELYGELGWSTEASGIFEEFISTYSEHPLTGGVLLNAGLGFLQAHKYIEAALIFRRLVEEPKWSHYHLKGALGLANATALSKAWQQASYWYQVVEVEEPRLIRLSSLSSYHYGLTESHLDHHFQAIDWFLTTYNLHRQDVEAGHALIQIGDFLYKKHHDMAALWFFHEAALVYKSEEPGRRGELALVRWVVSYLASDHSKEQWEVLYDRFNALEIYLSVSWDGVIESTRILARSPEIDIADEAQFLLAQGYQETDDTSSALQAYRQLVESAQHESWREKAQGILTELLLKKFRDDYERQAWVNLIRTYNEHKVLISLLPTNLEWMRMLADAYRLIGLPRQAIQGYDEMLTHHLDPVLHEEIVFWKVRLANDLAEGDAIRQAADVYAKAHPSGKRRADIAMILGHLDRQDKHLESAITHFTQVIEKEAEQSMKQRARQERARAYQELGQFDAAIADYRQLIKDHSVSLGIQLSLADLLYEQKRFTEAVTVYQPIAESDSAAEAKTWARFRLAMCFQETGKSKTASELLEDLRQPGQDMKDLEVTIQSAAAAVVDEFIPIKSNS